jgi:ABC-type oligopeptide transport system substrate-binding subunit
MIRSRTFASALFAAAALLGAGVAPASAQSAHSSAAAVSCYGGAKTLTYHYQAAAKEYGTYTTSSRCNDINLRLVTDVPGVYLDACVVFTDHTTKCNNGDAYTTHGTEWATVATDVLDGTHFVLRVHAYDTDAQNVTFQIAY